METKMATVITGDSSRHTDEAVEWLKANGAKIEDHACLSIITLPDTMELEHSTPAWRYTVSRKVDEHCGKYVEICTDADPYKVEMRLEGEDIEEDEEEPLNLDVEIEEPGPDGKYSSPMSYIFASDARMRKEKP